VLERHPQIGFRARKPRLIGRRLGCAITSVDGSGLPDRVSGEDIARRADHLRATLRRDVDRVYRSRLTDDEAIAELARCSGRAVHFGSLAALADEAGVSAAWPVASLSA
jgi:hypothetical protein